jgi:hypothetical protein
MLEELRASLTVSTAGSIEGTARHRPRPGGIAGRIRELAHQAIDGAPELVTM